jgi:hypothetical protein
VLPGFHNRINSSLFRDTAKFMKAHGFLAAGYNYVTLGGIGYANGSTWPDSQHGWGPDGPGNITRNASGYLQVDPIRFPGGNEGMRQLTDEIRAMGYKWGHCECAMAFFGLGGWADHGGVAAAMANVWLPPRQTRRAARRAAMAPEAVAKATSSKMRRCSSATSSRST